jgi:L-Lysine epsilon oxidase N-terminal/L-lysine epsilon oxidase C-terminal domain/von Willebrand factor type A domain
MATVYRIHPAIGIARVGNSPEFFIGPERPHEIPEPTGGFKDAQCRVKRQAARFRIYAHHDNGTVEEITDAEADITWTVHLVNKKAAYAGRGNTESAADLSIDPGARSTTGPNQQQLFDTGVIRFAGQPVTTVPLGEMRSDTQNRLLVFGGGGHSASPGGNGIGSFWGNAGWFDDVADGPVTASITLRASNTSPPVMGAWVLTTPPKFAPHQDSPTTLWDRLHEVMVTANLVAAPTTTSYTQDVYPILQRGRDIKWVYNTGAHGWADPVIAQADRNAIFNRLRPLGNMPQLNGAEPGLMSLQYAHMERWNNNNFANDWVGVPAPDANVTPAGLDRAALDACVGAAFFPGIEAGGLDAANRPILNAAHYVEAFRIDAVNVAPGTMSAAMALPWQADFYACAGNWWPVPRPNQVKPQGSNSYQDWARGVSSYEDMVANWHSLGFVVKQGNVHVEVERCDTATITLLTPYLNFIDIPQGPMGMVREQPLAISFEVSAPSTAVTLEYAPGGGLTHLQLIPGNTSITVGPTAGNSVATARLWVIYRTGAAPSAIATQNVTVREPVSGQTWNISIDANTIARKTAAVALVLDRSGSMAQDRGDGQSKHASLQQAAETFVDVMLEGDGVGLVRYDQDAQVIQPVLPLGNGSLSDLNRGATVDLIRGPSFNPAGATSIGDGIFEGRNILNNAGAFDVKALTVLTDGVENRARYISDVAGSINELTYAIGLGTPQNTSAAALQNISGNNGGFLLITGAIDTDKRFLLQKYFLQILAGVSNAEIVLDPDGQLVPGAVHRIPFQLTDADTGVDVILLSPYVHAIDFRLQTPTGLILEPWHALSEPAMRYVLGKQVSYYRLVLPTQLVADRYDQGGTWQVLLTIGKPRTKPSEGSEGGVDLSILRGLHASPAMRARAERAAGVPTEQQRQFALAQNFSSGRLSAAASSFVATHEPGSSGGRRTLPYSVIVHSYSSVALRAELQQGGYEPGATMQVHATLTQSGLPLDGAATVWAELTRPDGTMTTLSFQPLEPGHYRAEFVAGSTGTWRLRVRARGQTRKGLPFTRERSLTAAVWRGGDHDADTSTGHGGRPDDPHDSCCEWLRCVLARGGVIQPELEKRLHAAGLDLDSLRKCLAGHCGHGRKNDPRQDG